MLDQVEDREAVFAVVEPVPGGYSVSVNMIMYKEQLFKTCTLLHYDLASCFPLTSWRRSAGET